MGCLPHSSPILHLTQTHSLANSLRILRENSKGGPSESDRVILLSQSVEEEADVIWKYQMYGLVDEFSLRPSLPPPFTPLFFFYIACCKRGIQVNIDLSEEPLNSISSTLESSETKGRNGCRQRNLWGQITQI